MCYDVAYLSQKQYKYAQRFNLSQDELNEISKALLPHIFTYHTNGFQHQPLPVITHEKPNELQFYEWGLVPFWVKNPIDATKIANQTLNARGESIFEKPSFRAAAKHRRCAILVDGFYEHHHNDDGTITPFYIQQENEEPFLLGGLWESWELEQEGLQKNTCTIVTTQANELLTKIHNNPKLKGDARMPVIINDVDRENWINPDLPKEEVMGLIKTNHHIKLKAHAVRPIRGKHALGNRAEVMKKIEM